MFNYPKNPSINLVGSSVVSLGEALKVLCTTLVFLHQEGFQVEPFLKWLIIQQTPKEPLKNHFFLLLLPETVCITWASVHYKFQIIFSIFFSPVRSLMFSFLVLGTLFNGS